EHNPRGSGRGRGSARAPQAGAHRLILAHTESRSDLAAPLTAQDRVEIMDLFAEDTFALDQRSVEGYADVFTPDGVLEHIGGQATGREEILKRAQYLLDSGRAHPNLRHFVGLPAIRGDQERAFASTYCAILELEDAVIRL